MKKRLVAYAVLIVVIVSASLFVLTNLKSPNRGGFAFAGAGLSAPTKAFEPSEKLDQQASEGFKVTKKRAEVTPTAGQESEPDWPQFNGSNRDNKSSETGLLQNWPKDGPELIWSSTGLGIGYSTVAVADGVLYTMGNKGESEAVIALDAGTGEKIWSTPIAWASKLSAGDGPRSTPTVTVDAVIALGGNGDLACLEKGSGKVRWRKNIMHEFDGGVPGWGVCESVLIDQHKVICTPGGSKGTIVALDVATGEPIWTSVLPDKDGAGYASAVVAKIGGVRQYVQFPSAGTVSVRAGDGKFLWRENSAANPTANCSSPLIENNLVFSASSYGQGGALVRVTGDENKLTAERVYHTPDMKNHHGDMVIVDGLVYGSDDAIFTCLELETGKVKWQNRSVGKGSVTFADGRIYLRSETGPIALIEPSGEGYREKGRFNQPDRSGASAWSHPVVAAGKLFLRDQDLLLCYDVTAAKAP